MANALQKYKNDFIKGTQNGVEQATYILYKSVLAHCYDVGIENHEDAIHWEYDKSTNTGKVYTFDWVIIFNEMGTGIVGSDNPHPLNIDMFKDWKYDVNNHGEKGWKYPKPDGSYGWTRGLPSRHMFADAYEEIKPLIGNIINVEINKSVKAMY